MNQNEIKKEIEKVEEKITELDGEYVSIEESIDTLENRLIDIDYGRGRLIGKKKALEMDLIDQQENRKDRSEFKDAFIKCSWFCDKNNIRKALSYVHVKENELEALDGYKLIKIKCNEIPKDIQNTFIKWDIRKNFKEKCKRNIETVNTEGLIELNKSNIKINISTKDFKNTFFDKNLMSGDTKAIMLKHKDKYIVLNKEFLERTLMAFEGMEIDVYFPEDNAHGIVIESENQQAIVLPIRYEGE